MIKFIIDGITVEVPEGANVLEAAKKVGIVIPHFCYHPALGSAGACRLCAMKFIEGPIKGVQMSCMVTAADGMVVSTTDGEAAKLRAMVIEWLMINHPHDCPVCDEGGMCLLQDYTIAGGHGRRRYKGRKRTFKDQYLGEFIQHEMNRCIQCYRCARFYQDYAGGTDFGPMQIANKTFFGRSKDGWLESEFSGNLAFVCPTGVFTDKAYRFKARLWDLQRSPSICPHCALGCNTIPGARYRELLNVTARENQKVNGWFICDRGQFGYGFANHPDRPRVPLVYGLETTLDNALTAAATRIREIAETYGPGSVAFVGSARAPIEANYALMKLARAIGSDNICFSPEPERERRDRRAAQNLNGLARPLRDVEFSDFIVCAGADPINEAPMLALMMRQAARRGARIFVFDPRPVRLPFKFAHTPVPPEKLPGALKELVKGEMKDAKSVTIIAGTNIGDEALIDMAASEAARLKSSGMDCGLMYVMAGANSFGAALLAGDGPCLDGVVEGMSAGRIKALVVMESDPVGLYPGELTFADALARLECFIVMDYLPTETVKRAQILLPSTAYAETDGVFVSNEGRAQAFKKVFTSGIPINMMGPEAHPPRAFSSDVPGRSMDAWRMTLEIAHRLDPSQAVHGAIDDLRREMAEYDPIWGPLAGLDPEGPGAVLDVKPSSHAAPSPVWPALEPNGLRFLAVELTFGTEELSTYSAKTQLKAPTPYVMLNPDDAARLGITSGMRVEVKWGEYSLRAEARVAEGVAESIVITPRLPGTSASAMHGKCVVIKEANDD